jgi:outer membrane protein W
VNSISLGSEINYENYSLDSQYYFNTERDLRPYLTAGFGETMWKKDDELKSFQINGGVGAHYKLNKNFALQLDWRYYHSTSKATSDNNVSARIVYLLGNGER